MSRRPATARAKGEDSALYQLNQVKDILQRVDAMPLLDTRSEDEILGYDEQAAESIAPEV